MAQQTTVTLTDDIDGGRAVESVSFGLDGAQYEIDLNAKNAKNLRKVLTEFIDAGRTIHPAAAAARVPRNSAASPTRKRPKENLTALRVWANENGIPVAARGRISQSLKEQYAASKTQTTAA